MKKQLLILSILLLALQTNGTQRGDLLLSINNKRVSIFVNHVWVQAKRINEEHGIPMSLILGVCALETKYGTSRRCVEDCNFFAVKRNHKYCVYNSMEESFDDFVKVLKQRCYKNLKPISLPSWYEALKCCGYFQSKTYIRKLNWIIYHWGFDKLN
jgi:flagellum-specific peptidoglycan hydrolase FlgJ